MKTPFLSTRLFRHALPLLLSVGTLASTLSSGQGAAIMPLDFIGGGSTSNPETGAVDAWTGAINSGWLTEWGFNKNGSITLSTATTDTASLTEGKNRLAITVKKTAKTGTDQATIHRKYDASLVGSSHTVNFQFRLDSTIDDISRISIFDAETKATAPTSASNIAWYISAEDGKWKIYDGTRAVNTEITLAQGQIYDFTITITDSTYGVTIKDSSGLDIYISPSNFKDTLI